MKIQRITKSVFATLLLAAVAGAGISAEPPPGTDARTQAMEHKFEKAKQYYGECQGVDQGDFEKIRPHLKAFTDMEVMAEYMSDPAKFAQLAQTIYDPRTIHVMMKCSTEPVMWDTWMSGMTDFDKMMRTAMRFMNPAMYMNWMMAPMNPNVWGPMMGMMDPNMMARWTTAMANPAFYQPFFAPMDPNWYTPRMQWMMDPRSMQPMFNMFNMPNMIHGQPTAVPVQPNQ